MTQRRKPERKKDGPFDFLKRNPMEIEFKIPGLGNPGRRHILVPRRPKHPPKRGIA